MEHIALTFALKAVVEKYLTPAGVQAYRTRRGVAELTSFARHCRQPAPPLLVRLLQVAQGELGRGEGGAARGVAGAGAVPQPPPMPDVLLLIMRPRNLFCVWLTAFLAFFVYFAHHNLRFLLAAPPGPSSPLNPSAAAHRLGAAASAHAGSCAPSADDALPADPAETGGLWLFLDSLGADALSCVAAALLLSFCGLFLRRYAAAWARGARPGALPDILALGSAVGTGAGALAVLLSVASSILLSPRGGAPATAFPYNSVPAAALDAADGAGAFPGPEAGEDGAAPDATLLRLLRTHRGAEDPSLALFWETYTSTLSTLMGGSMQGLPVFALWVFIVSFVVFFTALMYAQRAAPVRWEQHAPRAGAVRR